MIRHITLALTVLLSACSAGDSHGGEDSTTLHRGNRSEPLTLDPHIAVITDARSIITDMFVGLYQLGPDGLPVPALAQEVIVSGDGLTWTFTLRQALWSDGTAITAQDVIAGLERALDPATLNQFPSPLFFIENAEAVNKGELPLSALGLEAIDERTVRMDLERPAPYLPTVLMMWGQPLPRHVFEAHGTDWVRPENIVVSGPFDLVEWRSNNYVHLRANPEFYQADQLCLSDVYFHPTVDTAAAERRVRNGEIDLNIEFTSTSLEFLQEAVPEMVSIGPGVTTRDVFFNASRAPFNDPNVRNALSMAIDRVFIAEEVLRGADDPNFRILPPGMNGAPDGVRLGFADIPIEDRRVEARRLLGEAGFGPDNPLRFTFRHQPSAAWPRVAPVLQNDWQSIADWVEVEILVRDSQIHYDDMRRGDYEVATSGWSPDFDDPYAFLMQYETRAGEINYSQFSDPVFDDLIARAVDEVDPQLRATLYAEAEQYLLDQNAFAPLFVESRKELVSPRVRNFRNNPTGNYASRWLCVD